MRASTRAPSLFESYFITPDKNVFGSETLEPEKANTLELGYQYAKDKFSIQALAYYSDIPLFLYYSLSDKYLGRSR